MVITVVEYKQKLGPYNNKREEFLPQILCFLITKKLLIQNPRIAKKNKQYFVNEPEEKIPYFTRIL